MTTNDTPIKTTSCQIMTRHEILAKCPEGFKAELQSFIDETETQVLACADHLKTMESPVGTAQVEACYGGLIDLSRNLY
tara:strand:+ start:384 stop:620 length:237 start_codon:yes stop_codon:yes gene_type:complete